MTSSNTALPVDVETIRDTYTLGLNVFAICPATRAEALTLHATLRRHVELLMPEVQGLAAMMRGVMRTNAVHVLVRTRQVLAEFDEAEPDSESLEGPPSLRDQNALHDLAVSSRILLSLFARPGPLGEPVDAAEIAERIGRRVCGACRQPIDRGEPVERKVFASDSGGGIRGVVHAELCVPRRPVLIVPPQPLRP